MSTTLTDEQRRQVFADVVAAQDEGLSVLAARTRVAKQHNLGTDVVKDIEREGIDQGWPPIGD